MKTLRGKGAFAVISLLIRRVSQPLKTLRDVFLVSVSAQALKWASFYSCFWACFRKIRLFSEGLRHVISDIKISTLAASAWSLRIVAVRTC